MSEPTVSVILPTFNRAATLREAVDSVLRQSFGDFELIVVDDGSSDGTGELLAGISDRRVRVLRNDVSRGASAARNRGIQEARGDFIAFQDSDDLWLPDKLARQMERFRDGPPDLGVVYTAVWREEAGRRMRLPAPNASRVREGRVRGELLRGNWITIHVVVKKMCFERCGLFDEALPRLVDWDLFLRLSKEWTFAFVDEPLTVCRIRSDGLTQQYDRFIAAYERILEKNAGDIRSRPGLEAWHWAGIGNRLCLSGFMKDGRAYLGRAARAEPGRLTYRGARWLSFFGRRAYGVVVGCQRRWKGAIP